jgi:hypothetical protein
LLDQGNTNVTILYARVMADFNDVFCDPLERSEGFVYPKKSLNGMTEEERMELERHDIHLTEAMAENHKNLSAKIVISRHTNIPLENIELIEDYLKDL